MWNTGRMENWYLARAIGKRTCHVCGQSITVNAIHVIASAGTLFYLHGQRKWFGINQNICFACIQRGMRPTTPGVFEKLCASFKRRIGNDPYALGEHCEIVKFL